MNVAEFMGGNFLRHEHLPAPIQTWTVSAVDRQLVGEEKEEKLCIHFSEYLSKPYPSNVINCRRCVALYGIDATNWIGKRLVVYRSTCDFAGRIVQCIRLCGPGETPPDPICDLDGHPVPYQPPAPAPQQETPVAAPQQEPPVAAPQEPPVPPSQANPFEADAAQQQNSPPST